MNVKLTLALRDLANAKLTLAAHRAVVEMHRDAGDGKAVRAAQARVNGFRAAVGKAAYRVRLAEGS